MADRVAMASGGTAGWRRGDARPGLLLVLLTLLCLLASRAEANGVYRNGVGARAMALGGADVAWADDALGAMGSNPAGLGWLQSHSLTLGLSAVTASGEFTNSANTDGSLDSSPGWVPDGALALRVGSTPLTIGISVIPQSLLSADWRYFDTPGGLGGVSYGLQEHRSEILVLRSAIGLGWAVTPNVAVGASLGLVYNENRLHAPYIFQTQETLRGAKTLLDLETSGFGWNGSFGILVRPHETVQIGVSYMTPTRITTTGHATGNAGVQLAALGAPFRPDFRYDAEVETTLPQMVQAGVSWKPHRRWRVIVQVDWIDWSGAFDDLPITLRNGNNADINGFVGSGTLRDTPALDWRDRFVYRAGVEYALTDHFALRAGYAYGKSPVPDHTLTPLTAAITEHTLTAGVGYRRGPFRVDLAYQYDLPASQRVGQSALLSGEYSQSRVEVELHWVTITASIEF